MSGARDASEAGHQSWQVHALLWSPIQAGPAVGAKVGWERKNTTFLATFRPFLNGFAGKLHRLYHRRQFHGNLG